MKVRVQRLKRSSFFRAPTLALRFERAMLQVQGVSETRPLLGTKQNKNTEKKEEKNLIVPCFVPKQSLLLHLGTVFLQSTEGSVGVDSNSSCHLLSYGRGVGVW